MRPELIQASDLLRRNTPEAVEEAIGLLQNTVYSFSMKVCGHPEDAEDTMQEVLSRSLTHLTKIQDPKALAVWLYTVTKHRCWRMRRKSVYAPKSISSLDELMPGDVELKDLLASAEAGPDEQLLAGESSAEMRQAIDRVPVPLRMVLVLHDMEELTTEEVAQILDLQTGTVRVRLHRARLSVRKELSQIRATRSKIVEHKTKTANGHTTSGRNKKKPDSCREIFSNLSEYLDGRIEPKSCEEMREHIQACPSCVAFLKDLRAAIERCRGMRADCDPLVAARLRAVLTREYLKLLHHSGGR